ARNQKPTDKRGGKERAGGRDGGPRIKPQTGSKPPQPKGGVGSETTPLLYSTPCNFALLPRTIATRTLYKNTPETSNRTGKRSAFSVTPEACGLQPAARTFLANKSTKHLC